MDDNDKIARALGLRPLSEVAPEIVEEDSTDGNDLVAVNEEPTAVATTTVSQNNQEHLDDIEFARNNIKNMIESGNATLKSLTDFASQAESPRAFEVVSSLLNTMLAANKDFVEMSSKRKYAKEETPAATQGNVTNNNLIISTSDLIRMLNGKNVE